MAHKTWGKRMVIQKRGAFIFGPYGITKIIGLPVRKLDITKNYQYVPNRTHNNNSAGMGASLVEFLNHKINIWRLNGVQPGQKAMKQRKRRMPHGIMSPLL